MRTANVQLLVLQRESSCNHYVPQKYITRLANKYITVLEVDTSCPVGLGHEKILVPALFLNLYV